MKSRLQKLHEFMDEHHFRHHESHYLGRRVEVWTLMILGVALNSTLVVIIGVVVLISQKIINEMMHKAKLEMIT